jgi:hypothetical protein
MLLESLSDLGHDHIDWQVFLALIDDRSRTTELAVNTIPVAGL